MVSGLNIRRDTVVWYTEAFWDSEVDKMTAAQYLRSAAVVRPLRNGTSINKDK